MTMKNGFKRNWLYFAITILLISAPDHVSAHKGHEEARRKAATNTPESVTEATPTASVLAPELSAARSGSGATGDHDPGDHSAGHRVESAPAAAAEPPSNVPKPLAWVGRFHPPLTHFPIALLSVAALAEFLAIRTRSSYFENVVHFSVLVGAISAVGAATLGWLFGGFHLVDDEWPMTAHRWVGTTTALLSIGLLVLLERARQDDATRIRFRILLFTAAAVVGVTGFLGGALVYGLDHYAWSFES